ncbi:DUF6515 family protein [Aureivirga sp. CE67]|uniref:DUF6515 family protein n=1 Tax=Aureivirga sp. CE67 TaxID=1788983 RepID=UPI0018CAE641|nr:DUF6515 family protein [Aureivirga sp. CE67]
MKATLNFKIILFVFLATLTFNTNAQNESKIERSRPAKPIRPPHVRPARPIHPPHTRPARPIHPPHVKPIPAHVVFPSHHHYIPPYRHHVRHYFPHRPVIYYHHGHPYHFYDGRYWRPNRNRFIFSAPPFGLRINLLPIGFQTVIVGTDSYFYFKGTFYKRLGNQYEVIHAPYNAVVYELPEEAVVVNINGKKYYEYNHVLYKVVTTPRGKAFKVVNYVE